MDKTIGDFDAAAGLTTQHEKTEYAMTDPNQKKRMLKIKMNGYKPKCPEALKIVGFTITAARHKIRKYANERCAKAVGSTR